ncbi:hypothetical protein [Parerythrobacter lacustris]|uniref:17 kDa surface antigen n=1 Tax=Parerythrobacter lacustris TaxID=2969984 RepID=A0ABT1XS40_9SPHN|nr:hypothetical protein [Parerythrobacter lacustris]MCR2834455.1 hypothetical protein [Parerythrobacter lacustris]
MTSRHLFALGTAGLAAAVASTAAAQPAMTYEGSGYEYAVPVPKTAQPVIYQSQPVVQPLPPQAGYSWTEAAEAEAGADYEDGAYHDQYFEDRHPAPPHHQQYYNGPAEQTYRHAPPMPAAFDRDAWLDECREVYRSSQRGGSGGAGGGILGAIAGGVIGNRVADGDRLAGTLIGAGVGGLAGLAIGSAIDAATRKDDAREYCESYLDRYLAGGSSHHGTYPAGAYPYGHAYYGQAYYPVPMMYVQVMVPVERRAIIREYVEYVDEPVTVYEEVVVEEVRERAVPAPSKAIPIKRAPEPTKYIKND